MVDDDEVDVLASTNPDLKVPEPNPSAPRGLVWRRGIAEELDEVAGEFECR